VAVPPVRNGNADATGLKSSVWTEALTSTAPVNLEHIGPGKEFESMEEYFPPPLEKWLAPYASMLDFLLQQGFLERLPVDEQGLLRVSVPFCAGFMECPLLPQFIFDNLLKRPGVCGASILGTELKAIGGNYWPKKERYVAKKFPGVRLQLRLADLAQEALPPCSLCIGVHPEASRLGVWVDILSNVIRSTRPGGLVVFACYFDVEVKATLAVSEPLGLSFQVFENPYYKLHPLPASPNARFIMVGRV